MPPEMKSILIVDDDPEHLKIYGWLVKQAGFAHVRCLVRRAGPEFDPQSRVDLVLLDYVLNCDVATVEVAQKIRAAWPDAPLVLLSDVHGLPVDMEPVVNYFVRKGEPAKLIATLNDLLGAPERHPVAV